MTAVTGPLLAGAEIRIDGQALDPSVQAQMLEVRVEQHLRLPDRASIRLADPRLELADSATFALGASFEVLLTARTTARRPCTARSAPTPTRR
jgi:hypothetical protein